jgi:uncharacterized protein YecE (DUF72 family)
MLGVPRFKNVSPGGRGEAPMKPQIYVGVAGWSVPKQYAEHFLKEGSHLERFARTFTSVEINSSFYRPHKPATYERWADSVPDDFKFSVKLPKEITHTRKLVDCEDLLHKFLFEIGHLGEKLGPVLVQFPPSFPYYDIVGEFLEYFRDNFKGDIVCEPRHETWADEDANELLKELRIARVAADPVRFPGGDEPGGWRGLEYWRLHGSPRIYYDSYSEEFLKELSEKLLKTDVPKWCIFDNTATFGAVDNGMLLMELLKEKS